LIGEDLKKLVEFCDLPGRGGIIDESYEFFHETPDSAIKYIKDIDSSNIFVVSSATKGLQAPGLRIGWVISSKRNIELFRNFSSIAMGGVSKPSQIIVSKLLELNRVSQARVAVNKFYLVQRERYANALKELGFVLYTGEGGFYHWCKLPNGITAEVFNDRLFKHKAAILPGTLTDMLRRGKASPLTSFIRFSFGPLPESSFDEDIQILSMCINA
jgi:DNA-binding transcriptional MocR family regulator